MAKLTTLMLAHERIKADPLQSIRQEAFDDGIAKVRNSSHYIYMICSKLGLTQKTSKLRLATVDTVAP